MRDTAVEGRWAHLRARLAEPLRDEVMVGAHRLVERRAAAVVDSVDVGVLQQKVREDVHVALARRRVQRRARVIVDGVDVAAKGD